MLLEFLNTYGNVINYDLTEVSPNLPNEASMHGPFPQNASKMFMMMNSNQYITVCDPLNKNNNVTRSAHKFYVIRVSQFPLTILDDP